MTELRTRIVVAVTSIVLALLFLGPTISPDLFGKEWLSKPISLGLDLRGGAHLVYQIKKAEAVKTQLQAIGNSIRSDLRQENVGVTKIAVSDKGELQLTVLSQRSAEKVKEKAKSYNDLQEGNTETEGDKIRVGFTVSSLVADRIERDAVIQAIDTLRNRVDAFGVAEPIIQQVGADRVMLQMPGETRIEKVKELVGKVAKLEFRLVPLPGSTATTVSVTDKKTGRPMQVEDQVLMTGTAVKTALLEPIQGRVEIGLRLTADGAQTFGRITSEHTRRQLAVIMDGVVYSDPEIREPIWGGTASISGNFGAEEAKQLVTVLRSGSLPAPLEVVEERTVGPSLGAESIRKGIYAILLGFAFIIVFMLGYYRKAGLVAVVTLGLNLLLVVAILAAFGATLTLPGLAGMALTVGMAVDANVIIFERIRDELRNGVDRDGAIRLGFDKAMSAIIDSNLTSLITALILYWLGTGPIRGFAVTLAVGLITTIFCATFVARIFFDGFALKGKKGLSI